MIEVNRDRPIAGRSDDRLDVADEAVVATP
jgi:hypothetical protein